MKRTTTTTRLLLVALIACVREVPAQVPQPGRLSAAGIPTLDVVRATPANPRHDHQLIFPLQDGRLMLLWSEYYRPAATDGATAKVTLQHDNMPCRIAAKTSADGGRTWGESFVFQENSGKFNVKHPNLLRLPSGEVLFF